MLLMTIMRVMEEKTKTTITVSKETAELLKDLGRKGDSYDEIIRRLIGNGERKNEQRK